MKRLLLLLALYFPMSLFAQNLEALRGSWIADIEGERHIYYIVLRNGTVTGTYCVDCADRHNVAIIDDGMVTANGLSFALYHYPENADPFIEQVEATLQNDGLHMTIRGPGDTVREQDFHRTPPVAAVPRPAATPAPASSAAQPAVRVRAMPGAPEPITPASVSGLWLTGAGPGKQHFMFLEHKGGLRGLVCGPCDSVASFGPLEPIIINGNSLTFDIVHEDNGFALAEHGPHSNVATGQISKHEMILSVVPSFEGPDFTPIEMTLLGPIRD